MFALFKTTKQYFNKILLIEQFCDQAYNFLLTILRTFIGKNKFFFCKNKDFNITFTVRLQRTVKTSVNIFMSKVDDPLKNARLNLQIHIFLLQNFIFLLGFLTKYKTYENFKNCIFNKLLIVSVFKVISKKKTFERQ